MEEAEQTQPPPLDLSVIKDDAAWRSKCATSDNGDIGENDSNSD